MRGGDEVFPGMGGVNPKQMSQLMRQMGIKSSEVEAAKVIVEKKDGGKIIVSEPSVTEIEFQGQRTLQVAGKFAEEEGKAGGGEDSDVQIIVEQTGASEQAARAALDESGGDLAQAILKLSRD